MRVHPKVPHRPGVFFHDRLLVDDRFLPRLVGVLVGSATAVAIAVRTGGDGGGGPVAGGVEWKPRDEARTVNGLAGGVVLSR